MNIVFIHPAHLNRKNSGSGVRPLAVRNALNKVCENVDTITEKGFKTYLDFLYVFLKSVFSKKVDLVYFENLSGPHILAYKRYKKYTIPFIKFRYFFFLLSKISFFSTSSGYFDKTISKLFIW